MLAESEESSDDEGNGWRRCAMTPITGMGGMLHPLSAKARIIVALRAYFDESGTH